MNIVQNHLHETHSLSGGVKKGKLPPFKLAHMVQDNTDSVNHSYTYYEIVIIFAVLKCYLLGGKLKWNASAIYLFSPSNTGSLYHCYLLESLYYLPWCTFIMPWTNYKRLSLYVWTCFNCTFVHFSNNQFSLLYRWHTVSSVSVSEV